MSAQKYKCGGDLWLSKSLFGAQQGQVIRCPYCRKEVKLRRPFNGAWGWVQIPVHNAIAKAGGAA